MNDPRFWRGIIEGLDASWEATKKRFAKYNKLNEDIMEEKKTKKMTKAEAFEYLKHKKVAVTWATITLQNKLFNIGYKWCDGSIVAMPMVDFLLIDDETFQFTESLSHFRNCGYTEISADDILSIEIVEEKKGDERKREILDEIAKLGEKISDLIEEYDGDIIIEIDQYEVLLRNSGNILYRK